VVRTKTDCWAIVTLTTPFASAVTRCLGATSPSAFAFQIKRLTGFEGGKPAIE
jgi:hypothetical protein